ncbi:ATP-dependent translocase ABCB1 [Episyrphus balteatus]|uniref:ATP-dependent translocase ABCB1 n=1 Tax=Episyrphus balteatus TaxID=286459 RepID=UPI002485DA3B|nr:ATP-dependent translocase ABCB1 [Episyrphus balteatus]
MGSTENKKDDLSFYNTNIILEDTNQNSKGKDKSKFSSDFTDKKEKKDTKEEAEAKKSDEAPEVPFLSMYKYSSCTDKSMYFVGMVCAILTGITTPLNSLIFGNLTDAMVKYGIYLTSQEQTRSLESDELLDAVKTFALQNAYIGAVMLICSYLSIALFNYAAQSQIYTIRGKFFKAVLHQDMSWYDFHQSGEVASRMNEDLTKMEDGLGEKIVIFINFVIAFISSLALAFAKGWQLALVCLTSLPVTLISLSIVGMITAKLSKKELNVYAKGGNIAEEALSGIRTVKAFEGEAKEAAAYRSNIVDARKINVKRGFFSGIGFGLLWFFIYSSYALAFWYGVGLVIKANAETPGFENYTPGTMITVFFSVMMGSMNIGMAAPYIEAFGIAKGACAKIYHLIEKKPEINPIERRGIKPKGALNEIEFRDVEFQYPTRTDIKILRKLNIKIKKGETVALVGSSGCGKSTCIQLLQRFYDPNGGNIFINNVNLKEYDVQSLRERIGVVGQEPVLFGTTIYENIRYGKEDATRAEIVEASKASNAHLFIQKLPQGYETLVGERGAQLSGGQKQRIAIARALVRNPEILLLDEATSALDTASEAKVQAALEKASEGRTTVIVAHRLSTIRRADKIIVIDKGQVVESGTHKELMEVKGQYFNLVTTQLGDESLALSPGIVGKVDIFTEDEDESEIAIVKEEEALQSITENDASYSLVAVMKLNKTEWPQILAGSISSLFMGCAMPLFAILFGGIIQILASNDPTYIRNNTNIYSLYFVICGVIVGVATFLQIFTFGIAGELLTERLRGMVFETMLKQEIGWFDDRTNGTGSLCARLSGDASAVQGATGQRIGTILQSLATLLLGVGLAMYYEWSLGLIGLAFTPFILIATYLQRKVMADESMGTAKAMETCTKLAVEVVSNVRTVVSLGREDMFQVQYMDTLLPACNKAKRNTHYRGLVYGLARSIMFFAYAATMYYGGYCIVNNGMPYGNVFKVSQALIMGTMSIANALAFAPNFQKGVTAAENIFKLLNRKPAIVDSPNASKKPWASEGNVTYDKVKFSYPSRKDITVLAGLDLEILRGQKIALVGPSGCGKSTCIQLLQRFYDVSDGSLSIDQKDVRSLTTSNLRRQLGIVSQEPVLFDRTIAENIAYGDNSRVVSETEIISAAQKANIHNFISTLPLGYETRLGEKGTQLSGGQKQRVAIARALIRNPRILLLDEATSALDAESEKVVQDALEVASEGRTSISIAHRLSTIVDSDLIVVIDAGKVSEMGTHQELIKMRGIYFNLYKLQSGAT